MDSSSIPLYYDGKTSAGQPVTVVADDQKMELHFVYADTGFQVVQDPISITYKGCTIAHVGEHLYVYLNKSGAAYLAIPFSDPAYLTIRNGILRANPSWFGKLMNMHVGILAFVFVILLIGGYFAIANIVPWVGLKIVSPTQEKIMGDKLFNAFIDTRDIDSEKTRLVNEVATALALSKTYTIDVTVIKNKEVNAFALPGGKIVVYTGILKSMKSGDELAALLAHEVSHINKRHSLRSLLRSSAVAILISVALNDASGVASVLVENAETLRSLGYSRNLEREADAAGMQLLVDNNIDPIAMRNLMLRLQEAYGKAPDMIAFLSTHPATKERIDNANAFANKNKSHHYIMDTVLLKNWDQIKK
jgi:Zn-dependent protease with chaperone function